jgi:hypothetical protein
MEDRIAQLIRTLSDGTASGKLAWEPTQRSKEYRLQLNEGSMVIDKWIGTDPDTGAESEVADISFFNEKGELVDRMSFDNDEVPSDFRLVARLHDSVRRKVMKVDELIDRLRVEIDSKIRKK